MPPFRARYSVAELEAIIDAVARSVDPHDPAAVAADAFDAAIPRSGWPDCPRAASLARRTGLPWPKLLTAAVDPARSLPYNVALARRDSDREQLPDRDEIAYALKLIAGRLGADTLTPDAYDHELGRLERASANRGGADRLLPTSAAITAACARGARDNAGVAGWDLALELAGLQLRPHAGLPEPGKPVPDAIDRFLTDVGCLPSSYKRLRQYAAGRFALADHRGDWSTVWQAYAQRRRRDQPDRWTPPRPPGRREHPPMPELQQPTHRSNRLRWIDPEVVIDGIAAAYLIADERGVELTQRLHRRPSVEHDHIPSPSTVAQRAKEHGATAAQWRAQARARATTR